MMVSTLALHHWQHVEFDADRNSRLTQSGPRYTSYPIADRFSDSFGYRDDLQAVTQARSRGGRYPLSPYLHILFCDTGCYDYGCNKIVTRNREKAATYLDYLKREVERQGQLLAGFNQIEQLHFGGGTPICLPVAQVNDLMQPLRRRFVFTDDEVGEDAIEVDPRNVSPDRVHRLWQFRFNCINFPN